jgi:carboxymethylenebutenolidase
VQILDLEFCGTSPTFGINGKAATQVERKRATDFSQGLLDLFDHYVHGEISRRQFLDGATKFAVGGLTAVAIWDSLKPNYALA